MLRDSLGIDANASVVMHTLAQGEHNSNFWFTHPATDTKYVLRINYTSQLGLKEQAAYEFDALTALRPSGRTPLPLLCDESRTSSITASSSRASAKAASWTTPPLPT